MKIIPNSAVYADKKLQPLMSEWESLESSRTFNKKDNDALPGLPEAEVHFFYYAGLERSDVKKDRCGK